MLCTCIYFAEIGSFDGEEVPVPPHDPGADPNDDQGMLDVEDHHEGGVDKHSPTSMLVPPFSRGD